MEEMVVMYYIAICDDDWHFADYIEKLLIRRSVVNDGQAKFYKFTSGEEFVKSFNKDIPFDLLVLDMQMEKMDGDVTAREFRKKYPHAVLVFCSGVCHPTVKSFEVNAYRYLMKSYNSDRLAVELKIVFEEVQRRKHIPRILLSYRNETMIASQEDILYVSIRKHGTTVYLYDRIKQTTKEQVCNKDLTAFSQELDSFGFAYAHNSYIINLSHVVGYVDNAVQMADGTVLSISRSREKQFKEALSSYLSNKY